MPMVLRKKQKKKCGSRSTAATAIVKKKNQRFKPSCNNCRAKRTTIIYNIIINQIFYTEQQMNASYFE